MHVKSVDALKCFAIMAVILGHIETPFTHFIFSWHMPLFFFIAGFFIKPEESVESFISKNAKRLLIPYVIFALVGLAVVLIKNPVLHRPEASVIDGLLVIFYWMNTAHITTYANVLWFLPTLFLCRLSVFVLLKFVNQPVMILLISVLLAWLGVHFDLNLPFALPQAMASMVWVYCGYVFFNSYRVSRWFKEPKFFIPSAVMLLIPLLYFSVPLLNLAEMSFSHPLYNYVYGLIMSISSLFIKTDFLSCSILVNWLGANTMAIFIFHTYTNNLSSALVQHFMPNAWVMTFLISLTILAVLLVLKQRIQGYKWAAILKSI